MGALAAVDPDSGESFTYAIVGGADAGVFSIGGAGSDELILTDGVLDFESQGSYSVVVRVTDSGGLTYDETLTVAVNNSNEAPTAITPTSFNLNENVDTSGGSSLGALAAVDPDSGESFAYAIVGGADAGVFSLGGAGSDELILTDGVLDFESQGSYTVIVRVTDSGANIYDETLTVSVNDLNESPLITSTSSISVTENQFTILTVTATDQDIPNDTVAFTLTGGADQGKFAIDGGSGVLSFLFPADFETPNDFDSDNVYEVQVTADDGNGGTTNQLVSVTVTDGININMESLWLTTVDDVSASGITGATTWTNGTILQLGDPDLMLEPGISNGSLNQVVNLDMFGDGDVKIRGLHFVTTDIMVGGTGGIQLLAGDVILATNDDESLNGTGLNSLDTDKEDVFVFRPDSVGNYAAGTFFMLLDNVSGNAIEAITLVETDTMIGDTIVHAGDFLFADNSDRDFIQWFQTTGVGDGINTSGTVSTLIDGTDLGFDGNEIRGIELIESDLSIGGANLNSGQIVLSMREDDLIGGISTSTYDVFYLDLSATTYGSGVASGTASLLLEGVEIGLDEGNEEIHSLTLVPSLINTVPSDIAPDSFFIDENIDTSSGSSLGTLSAVDNDSYETFSYTIIGGADAGNFSIGGANSDELLLTAGVLDHEVQDTYTVVVQVADSAANTYNETITVSVNDINETPSAITLSNSSVDENTNTMSGFTVGTLSAVDDDAAESFNYTIVGGADQANFTLGGGDLNELILTAGILDHESQDEYSVIVRVADSAGNLFDETITVLVADLNEAPTGITPTSINFNENLDTFRRLFARALAATDEDDGDSWTYALSGGPDIGLFLHWRQQRVVSRCRRFELRSCQQLFRRSRGGRRSRQYVRRNHHDRYRQPK